MSRPVGKGEKRDMQYLRMTPEKLEHVLAVGFYEDIKPGSSYFEQKFDEPRLGYATPDVLLSIPDDWGCPKDAFVATCVECGASDFWDCNNVGIGFGITHRTSLISRVFHGNSIPQELNAYANRCLDCYKRMIPFVVRFRELVELNYHINQLGKAINEKRRPKNNGRNPRNAC